MTSTNDMEGGPVPAGWTRVGCGVVYRQVNAGPAILIAYGGYTAQLGVGHRAGGRQVRRGRRSRSA